MLQRSSHFSGEDVCVKEIPSQLMSCVAAQRTRFCPDIGVKVLTNRHRSYIATICDMMDSSVSLMMPAVQEATTARWSTGTLEQAQFRRFGVVRANGR